MVLFSRRLSVNALLVVVISCHFHCVSASLVVVNLPQLKMCKYFRYILSFSICDDDRIPQSRICTF